LYRLVLTDVNIRIWKVDNESAHLAYSLLELTFVRSGSFSLSKDFADTDIQTMVDALCTA